MNDTLVTIDIAEPAGIELPSKGVAYFRLDENFKEFLQKCADQHGILGFEWEPNSWNFGVILRNDKEEGDNQSGEAGS